MTSSAGTLIVNFAFPYWAVNCTMGFSNGCNRSSAARPLNYGGRAFGGYEGRGVAVTYLCRLTARWQPRRGLPTVAFRRRWAPNFFNRKMHNE